MLLGAVASSIGGWEGTRGVVGVAPTGGGVFVGEEPVSVGSFLEAFRHVVHNLLHSLRMSWDRTQLKMKTYGPCTVAKTANVMVKASVTVWFVVSCCVARRPNSQVKLKSIDKPMAVTSSLLASLNNSSLSLILSSCMV